MTTFRIALANRRYPASAEESIVLATETIAAASGAGAAIVCFPECYVPGYRIPGTATPPPDEGFLSAALVRVGEAARASGIAVILGTERISDGRRHITAAVFDRNGSLAGFQDKVQLDPSEDDMFSPGSGRSVFEIDGVKFGVSICHEGWRYPETVRAAVRQGAQIVFHPHYHWPEPGGYKPRMFADPLNSFHEKAVMCRAAENTCYFASVNYATAESPTTSVVAGPDGSILAWQPYGRDGLLCVDVDIDAASGLLATRLRS
jgi:predicted amidohydrolase